MIAGYLAVRRPLGYRLARPEKLLGQFITYVADAGAETVTAERALAWATLLSREPYWKARRQRFMRRSFLWLTGLIPVIAAAACGAGGGTIHQGHTYRDAAGWTISVPPGWHAVRFSDYKDGITSAGVQLSNVPLPPPSLVPGFPIQVNGSVLPARGVGLVIATDTDPKLPRAPVAAPPLPGPDAPNGWRYWNAGSGSPYIEILWFRAHGTTFTACAKIGPKATGGDLEAVGAIVESLR